jgi:hypothetical protein
MIYRLRSQPPSPSGASGIAFVSGVRYGFPEPMKTQSLTTGGESKLKRANGGIGFAYETGAIDPVFGAAD